MKKRFVDPFFPNRPVDDPNRFSGREEQVDEVIDALYQIANGNPKHTIITGDRGIGKSSLLYQSKLLAMGNNTLATRFKLDLGINKYNFITVWHDIDQDQNLKKIIYGLLKDLQTKLSKILKKMNFELDLGGILTISKNEDTDISIAEYVELFYGQVAKAYEEVKKTDKNGIIFFVDEIDRIPPETGIASFFKLAAEKLNREGLKNIGFICAGITGAVQKLETEHASILRTFRDIPIPRLGLEDSRNILQKGFDSVGYTYEEEIFSSAFHLGAGFPEPIHLLGSEMLSVTDTNKITMNDFDNATKKIIEDVRRNELTALLKKAGYGKYQLILKAMAQFDNSNVPLNYISKEIKLEQNEYSTNIANLINREIIERVDKGIYCFVNPLLKEYIRNFGIIDGNKSDEI